MFTEEKLQTIVTASSFLTGLMLSVLLQDDIDTCLSTFCVVNYTMVFLNTILWLTIFVLGIILQLQGKDYSIVYQTIRTFMYLGIINSFLVINTSAWAQIVPYQGKYLAGKTFNTIIVTIISGGAACITIYNTYCYLSISKDNQNNSHETGPKNND